MNTYAIDKLKTNMVLQGLDERKADFACKRLLDVIWKNETYKGKTLEETIIYLIRDIYSGYQLYLPLEIMGNISKSLRR